MFAPWIRKVWIVTDGQVPQWLDQSRADLEVVDHRSIFTDPSVLPVFNSRAIESQLHHIDGLSEHYLYLNDDVFFGGEGRASSFFHPSGLSQVFLAKTDVIDPNAPDSEDLPVTTAAKNTRLLLEREFQVSIGRKLQHVPHPQVRSVVFEMEQRWPQVFTKTASNRFRDPEDFAIPSCLSHWYAYLTGRAVPGQVQYRYFKVSDPRLDLKLGGLLRRRNSEVFCVNESDVDSDAINNDTHIARFLESYFPWPSRWELNTIG
jgi:hypothetical protein